MLMVFSILYYIYISIYIYVYIYIYIHIYPHFATVRQARKEDSVSYVPKAILTGGVGLVTGQQANWHPSWHVRRCRRGTFVLENTQKPASGNPKNCLFLVL